MERPIALGVERPIAGRGGAHRLHQIGAPRGTRATILRQIPRSEVPPETARRVLTAELKQDVTTDLVAPSGEVRPGVTKRTTALRAGFGIRHRGAPPPNYSKGTNSSAKLLRERPGAGNVTEAALRRLRITVPVGQAPHLSSL